ncbi:hypothetical protein [Mesorhizobium sp. SP-1A]|jgi:hypothetical protein|uniref:hypothetical protein n=1 Tax=Mesorhizobium sp. SP-1A TaxID=3077840 RepID=UPI0028F6C1A5|nr:hypothetical protein [Mesorhizobium sp. SP-1A]
MNRKLAASILSALLYAHGLLGFAGLAGALLRDRTGETGLTVHRSAAQSGASPGSSLHVSALG